MHFTDMTVFSLCLALCSFVFRCGSVFAGGLTVEFFWICDLGVHQRL